MQMIRIKKQWCMCEVFDSHDHFSLTVFFYALAHHWNKATVMLSADINHCWTRAFGYNGLGSSIVSVMCQSTKSHFLGWAQVQPAYICIYYMYAVEHRLIQVLINQNVQLTRSFKVQHFFPAYSKKMFLKKICFYQ